MKLSITFSLYFYAYISIYFIAIGCNVQDLSARDWPFEDYYKACASLGILKNSLEAVGAERDYLAPQENHEFHQSQHDCIKDILLVLIDMYEKIIEATVTYYIMIHAPTNHNLHHIVARIIAEGVVKIIAIGGKESVHLIFNKKMSWQKKLGYGLGLVSLIILIKLGIDRIPKLEKNGESPFFYYGRQENQKSESGYIEGKFNNYK